MFCLNCGAEIPDDMRFCPSCGTPVGGNAAAPQAGETAHMPSYGAGPAVDPDFMVPGSAVSSSSVDSYDRRPRRQTPAWAFVVALTFVILVCGGTVAAFVLLGGLSPIGEEPENQVQVVSEQPGAPEPAPVEETESDDDSEATPGSSPVADLEPEQDAEPDAGSSGTSSTGSGSSGTSSTGSGSSGTSSTSAAGTEPFWGGWIGAFNHRQNALERAAQARDLGFSNVRVEFSSNWTELNQAGYYVVSAGAFSSKAEAERVLSSARQHFSDAYVKYTGTYK